MKLFTVLILAIASLFNVGILDAKYLLVNVGNQKGNSHIDYPEKGSNQIVTSLIIQQFVWILLKTTLKSLLLEETTESLLLLGNGSCLQEGDINCRSEFRKDWPEDLPSCCPGLECRSPLPGTFIGFQCLKKMKAGYL